MLHRFRLVTALGFLCLSGPPGNAVCVPSDGIGVAGLIGDEGFYRLATCGAPPGGTCDAPALRWKKGV